MVDHAHAARGAVCEPELRRVHPRHHHPDARGAAGRGLPVRGRRRRGRAARRAGRHRSLARGLRDQQTGARAQVALGALFRGQNPRARGLDCRPGRGRVRLRPALRPAAGVSLLRLGAGAQRGAHHRHAFTAVLHGGRIRRLAREAAAGCGRACKPGPRQRRSLRSGADRAGAPGSPSRPRDGRGQRIG